MEKKPSTVKERLRQWRALANAADEAERQLKTAGQATATPEYMALALRARMLRNQADREFAAISRAITRDGNDGDSLDGGTGPSNSREHR